MSGSHFGAAPLRGIGSLLGVIVGGLCGVLAALAFRAHAAPGPAPEWAMLSVWGPEGEEWPSWSMRPDNVGPDEQVCPPLLEGDPYPTHVPPDLPTGILTQPLCPPPPPNSPLQGLGRRNPLHPRMGGESLGQLVDC